ncbi:hypothetical protein [Mycoplasma nasistruthionis]|uniref:Variable surface lipoprotein n=1 Tax=Mycoplasma nasistruthionis TaxID=353852 RepID=A0A4Y6I771_9MOLU|nr:hypothetical protein [Mycoplasma nasistruthionis]QDF65049.1 hypothetical protein FIV53_01920 [Mycoplasma nasistruthionis]
MSRKIFLFTPILAVSPALVAVACNNSQNQVETSSSRQGFLNKIIQTKLEAIPETFKTYQEFKKEINADVNKSLTNNQVANIQERFNDFIKLNNVLTTLKNHRKTLGASINTITFTSFKQKALFSQNNLDTLLVSFFQAFNNSTVKELITKTSEFNLKFEKTIQTIKKANQNINEINVWNQNLFALFSDTSHLHNWSDLEKEKLLTIFLVKLKSNINKSWNNYQNAPEIAFYQKDFVGYFQTQQTNFDDINNFLKLLLYIFKNHNDLFKNMVLKITEVAEKNESNKEVAESVLNQYNKFFNFDSTLFTNSQHSIESFIQSLSESN